tara:strand:- start:2363 stop:2575 length:213 start_codon:yes stop_codon:yes gene_type:complete
MKIHINNPSVKNKPAAGDIKTSKLGVFERFHSKTRSGSFIHTSSGPVYHWIRLGNAPEGFKGRAVIEYNS